MYILQTLYFKASFVNAASSSASFNGGNTSKAAANAEQYENNSAQNKAELSAKCKANTKGDSSRDRHHEILRLSNILNHERSTHGDTGLPLNGCMNGLPG